MTKAYLCLPPPFTSVHVMIHAILLVLIGVLMLRLQNKGVHKIGVLPEGVDTLEDVARMEVEAFTVDVNFISRKLRP